MTVNTARRRRNLNGGVKPKFESPRATNNYRQDISVLDLQSGTYVEVLGVGAHRGCIPTGTAYPEA